jgi:hypothetical protein
MKESGSSVWQRMMNGPQNERDRPNKNSKSHTATAIHYHILQMPYYIILYISYKRQQQQ